MSADLCWPLLPGYHARRISLEEYRAACLALEDRIFGGSSVYAFDAPRREAPPLGETWSWGIYAGEGDGQDRLIGWHHAYAQDARTVYMADTGLLPEHQGRGLYTRLLPTVLDTFRAAGFTLVQSHHRATNNAVIVPKLRAGFVVQGLSLYEGGLNVALTLSLDDPYREAQDVRSGLRRARGEVARRLGWLGVGWPEMGETETRGVPAVPLPEVQGSGTDLGGGYRLWRVSEAVYAEVYAQLEAAAYATVSFDWPHEPALSAPTLRRYPWLIEHGGQVVGWQLSRQWDRRTAYMVNTALLPAHRGRGVYSRLLPVVLAALRAEGYDLIRSHHHATNTAVLLPKLRAGFRVQGLQVDEHGVMAVLLYAFDDVYRAYMDVRSGLTRPAGEVARRLGMQEK